MKSYFFSGRTVTLKMIIIAGLILILLIPQALIDDLIREREQLQQHIQKDVSKAWGDIQIVSGPFLILPYTSAFTEAETGKTISRIAHCVLFPQHLNIKSEFETSSKSRSLYKILLYGSDHHLEGQFNADEWKNLGIAEKDILWKDVSLAVGISDPKGINKEVNIRIGENTYPMKPGIPHIKLTINPSEWQQAMPQHTRYMAFSGNELSSGMHVHCHSIKDISNLSFSFDLGLNGSQAIFYTPTAKTTSVNMKSGFNDPSFIGEFLPHSHQISKDGFTADWKILEYNKKLPTSIKDATEIQISNSIFGIQIKEPVDHYGKNKRAVKYMVLFVLLIFLTVFLTEIMYKLRIHIFQYLLVGLAIALFFTLLLSMSEYLHFDYAYSISSAVIIILISWYSLSLFVNKKSSMVLCLLLSFLFGFIYLILQLEQYALLAGSLGLLFILFLTMYFTRKIKWYEEMESESNIIF